MLESIPQYLDLRRSPLAELGIVALSLIVLLGLPGCGDDVGISLPGGGEGDGESVPRFVYIANSGLSAVNGFEIDAETGVLTTIPGSPFGSLTTPWRVTVHPTGPWVYLGDSGSQTVHIFEIDPADGTLTETADSPAATGASSISGIAISSAGDWLYVSHDGGDVIRVFAVDAATGALTSTGPLVATGANVFAVAVSADDAYLYTATFGAAEVDGYAVNPGSGALTGLPGSPFTVGTGSPVDVATHPSGDYLYVADTGDGGIYRVVVNGDGTLGGTAFSPDGGAISDTVVVSPNGDFVYSFRGIGDLAAFTVGAGGNLTPATPPIYAVTTVSGGLTVDASGSFLLTANSGDGEASVFAIDPGDGSLSAAAGSPYAGGGVMRDLAVWAGPVP